MARPQRQRTVCFEPVYSCFCPKGVAEAAVATLTVDEFEVLRLVDFMGKSHEEAARQMKISRTTATEIYQSARYKVADSLVNGKQLCIAGGSYRLCSGDAETCTEPLCKKRKNLKIPQKGYTMRIAIPYQNEEIFQHFGHSEAFKFYDVEDNAVCASCVVPTNGSGHGALAGFLKENSVDVLLCGGIGGGAKEALAKADIRVFGGVKGRADDAAAAFLAGTLHYDPEAHCSHHHGEGHSCGDKNHTCGEHGCH